MKHAEKPLQNQNNVINNDHPSPKNNINNNNYNNNNNSSVTSVATNTASNKHEFATKNDIDCLSKKMDNIDQKLDLVLNLLNKVLSNNNNNNNSNQE